MKLLICDDDISTVDLIQNQLDLKEFGITRLLRAYNGVAAKEIIAGEKPELILCDIGMPQCNGIEVLKFVHNNGYQTEFAFLTCYESFEYARDAVRYGATNYLTKPLDLGELHDAMLSMVASAKAKAIKKARQDGALNEDSKINDFLRSLRDGFYGTDPQQIQKTMDRSHIPMKADSMWRLVCISADMMNAASNGWKPDIMRYSFQYLVQEAVADRLGFAYMISDVGERFDNVTLFVEADRLSEAELETRCRRTALICNNHMGISPVFLISNEVMLSDLAEEALPLKKRLRKYRMNQGKVFLYRDAEELDFDMDPVTTLDEGQILSFVKRNEKTKYMETISKLLDQITQNREGGDRLIAHLHHDLLQIFYGCLRDNHISAHDLFASDSMREIDARAEASMFDMMNFAAHLFDQSVEALKTVNESSDMISSVKAYIREHFRENIDRNEIAAVAYITPNYLSKRFHSETGMSLREFINELRIDEAKRLLLTTQASVSEVACEVGFENISYFSTVFRKLCGMSPVEWKTRKAEQEASV